MTISYINFFCEISEKKTNVYTTIEAFIFASFTL